MDEVQDPYADSFLRSKVLPTPISSCHLARPTIQSMLSAQPNARLILLSAPAGFGKTSELAALARDRLDQGHAVAWITLTAESNSSVNFFNQLIGALRDAQTAVSAEVQLPIDGQACSDGVAVMESLLAQLAQLEQPLLLVLDDLHFVSDPDLLSAVNRLVTYASNDFTLAVGTQVKPKLSLATWRTKDYLIEVSERELRLSEDEVQAYLQRCGLSLDAISFNKLYNHTEGWVTGIRLICEWLRGNPHNFDDLNDFSTDKAGVGEGANREAASYKKVAAQVGPAAEDRSQQQRPSGHLN